MCDEVHWTIILDGSLSVHNKRQPFDLIAVRLQLPPFSLYSINRGLLQHYLNILVFYSIMAGQASKSMNKKKPA
jgi:4-amino-4-deoxy-L-arabinose transferase-like glycosyltransferase